MSGDCASCNLWVIKCLKVYDDGLEVVLFAAESGKGRCAFLSQETAPDFGCRHWVEAPDGFDHKSSVRMIGSAFEHWKMGACPDCAGRGSHIEGGACHRCAGIGQVRHYDDGHVGEERTRKHPIELEREQTEAREAERARTQAILDGMPLPPAAEVIDGTVLKPLPKASVL